MPPPTDLKVALNYLGGYRNSMTFGLAGLDIEDKARLLEEALWKSIGGPESFARSEVRLLRSDRPDPPTNDDAFAYLRVTVMDPDEQKVGRPFSRAAVELALAHYPGFFLTSPPGDASPYAVYWPTRIPAELVPMTVVLGDERWEVSSVAPDSVRPTTHHPPPTTPIVSRLTSHASRLLPLGVIAGARSGDKGGNANVGFWVRTEVAYEWLRSYLTIEELHRLMPEADGLEIERYELPNLLAVNFVVKELLGEGVSSSTRTDPQAKSLGEFLRAKLVPIPDNLVRDLDLAPGSI